MKKIIENNITMITDILEVLILIIIYVMVVILDILKNHVSYLFQSKKSRYFNLIYSFFYFYYK